MNYEVVVDDCRCRSRSQVVQGEAVSKSVSAGGGERAGLGIFLKVLELAAGGTATFEHPCFGGPCELDDNGVGVFKHRDSAGTRK